MADESLVGSIPTQNTNFCYSYTVGEQELRSNIYSLLYRVQAQMIWVWIINVFRWITKNIYHLWFKCPMIWKRFITYVGISLVGKQRYLSTHFDKMHTATWDMISQGTAIIRSNRISLPIMRAWYSGCAWVSKTHEKCSIRLARANKICTANSWTAMLNLIFWSK